MTGSCAYCGAAGDLRSDGRVPNHKAWVIKRGIDVDGQPTGYPCRTGQVCRGSGRLSFEAMALAPDVRRCANPACRVAFKPKHRARIYCTERCRRRAIYRTAVDRAAHRQLASVA